jgi:transcriptional regulator with XRE-family HTH domain
LRKIAKRLDISRNTVRRYLRSETTAPAYAERQSSSAIEPYAFQLAGWLKTEAAESRKPIREARPCRGEAFESPAQAPQGALLLSAMQQKKGHPRVAFFLFPGGERGIRTPDRL